MAPIKCNQCGEVFTQTDAAARKGVKQCMACRALANRRRRDAREAAGLPRCYAKSGTRSPREAARDREIYATDPVARLKQKARAKLRKYVERGLIKRQPCEVCGATPTHGHHDDYARALDVRWLCVPHHTAVHQALGS